MTGVVTLVRRRVDPRCIVAGTLRENGCVVSMQDLPRERVAVNLERAAELDTPAGLVGRHNKRCDFVFVAEEDAATVWAAPLELKSANFRASDVAAQLQGGAAALEKLIPREQAVRFRPVIASQRVPKAQRASLMRQRVRFRGIRHRLVRMRCQSPLRSVLRS